MTAYYNSIAYGCSKLSSRHVHPSVPVNSSIMSRAARRRDPPKLITSMTDPLPGQQNYLEVLLKQRLTSISTENEAFLKRTEVERAQLKYELQVLESEKVKLANSSHHHRTLDHSKVKVTLPAINNNRLYKEKSTRHQEPSIYQLYNRYQSYRSDHRHMGAAKLESGRLNNAMLKMYNSFHSNCNSWRREGYLTPAAHVPLARKMARADRRLSRELLESPQTDLAIMNTPFVRKKKRRGRLGGVRKPAGLL